MAEAMSVIMGIAYQQASLSRRYKKQKVSITRHLLASWPCGEGGIRTPGASQLNGFQDRRNRPLCHLSNHKSTTFFYFYQIFLVQVVFLVKKIAKLRFATHLKWRIRLFGHYPIEHFVEKSGCKLLNKVCCTTFRLHKA